MKASEIKRRRAESSLKEIIPEALASLDDDRLHQAVVDVKCSNGLNDAKVYLDASFIYEDEKREIIKQLKKARSYIEHYCSSQLGWFKSPKFTFTFDEELEKMMRIDELFKQIENERNK